MITSRLLGGSAGASSSTGSGAHLTFDVMWEEAAAECEGVGGGWGRRRLRAFGGYRPPRRTRREKGDRGEK